MGEGEQRALGGAHGCICVRVGTVAGNVLGQAVYGLYMGGRAGHVCLWGWGGAVMVGDIGDVVIWGCLGVAYHCASKVSGLLPEDGSAATDVWIIDAFRRWHAELQQAKQAWLSNPATRATPPRLSATPSEETTAYWAFQTLRIMQIFDMLSMKRSEQPPVLAGADDVTVGDGCAVRGDLAGHACDADTDDERNALQHFISGEGCDADGDGADIMRSGEAGDIENHRHEKVDAQRCGRPALVADVVDVAAGLACGSGLGAEAAYAARLQRVATEFRPRAAACRRPLPRVRTSFLDGKRTDCASPAGRSVCGR